MSDREKNSLDENKAIDDSVLLNPTKILLEADRRPKIILKGKYHFEPRQPVACGGFSTVFLATCLDTIPSKPDSPPRHVAVKLFNRPTGANPAQMLKRELAALLALRHDRIPQVYDWNINSNPAFVAVKYYQRGSLHNALPLMGENRESIAWRLLIDILSALQAAHSASILHLDIKPGNILLDDMDGFALTDFGVSQGNLVSHEQFTIKGVGSRGYQAPEQEYLNLDDFDARTDLFGLGATTWTLLSGIPINRSLELLGEYAYNNTLSRLPAVSKYTKNCSPELEGVIMSLLAVNQADRPGSAAEVLANIEKLSGAIDASGSVVSHLPGNQVDENEAEEVIQNIVDPLWAVACESQDVRNCLKKFENNSYLSRTNERSYFAYVLLRGCVVVERNGDVLVREDREGTFLGEVSALTGRPRSADMRAEGEVWVLVINASDLERLIGINPGICIRLAKSLAERVHRESQR